MNVKDRLMVIDTNLEDLQAGIEAGSRAAVTLRNDTAHFKGRVNTTLLYAIVQHVEQLQACARDQRIALQELREGIARLRREVRRSAGAVRPPPADPDDR